MFDISGFRPEVDEIWALPRFYATVVIHTDVSGQLIGSIFKGKEWEIPIYAA